MGCVSIIKALNTSTSLHLRGSTPVLIALLFRGLNAVAADLGSELELESRPQAGEQRGTAVHANKTLSRVHFQFETRATSSYLFVNIPGVCIASDSALLVILDRRDFLSY